MIKTISRVKSSAINTLILLTIGTAIGAGTAIWVIQQNLDGVCSLISTRNQFVNLIQQDSK